MQKRILIGALACLFSASAWAGTNCKRSPELDPQYCDEKDWALVRKVAVAAGTPYNLAQFEKENAATQKK